MLVKFKAFRSGKQSDEYHIVVGEIPPCHISSAYGDPLDYEVLQDIASAFAAMDSVFVEVMALVLSNASRVVPYNVLYWCRCLLRRKRRETS